MTDPRRRDPDIIDADYVVLPASGLPTQASRSWRGSAKTGVAGMGLLEARPPHDLNVARRGGPIFWLFGLGLAAASFWASGGHSLVLDRLAAPDAGVRIASVMSRVDLSGAHPVLLVDGEAVRDGAGAVPGFEVDVAAVDGAVTRYRLGTSAAPNAPEGNFVFSGRFRAPTSGVRTVSVAVAD